jgi:hypothetical protein
VPYCYRCAICRITSASYATRAAAEDHGRDHRHAAHGGDHPDGEQIQHVPWPRPRKGEAIATIAFFALLLIALFGTFH